MNTLRRYVPLFSAGALLALAASLYLPFLGNPLVFDDLAIFSGAGFHHYATSPFLPYPRNLSYFTLAFPQVMWGYFPPTNHAHLHRVISLVFHAACVLALYRLILALGAAYIGRGTANVHDTQARAQVCAFVCAALFAVHPAAVYGAGYLVQRTIVMATLFSLLSMVYYARGLERGQRRYAVIAAVFYTLAVFSKEHSVLVPAAAVMMTPLLLHDRRFGWRYAGLYLLACLPAAVTVTLLLRWVVGAAYEPHVAALLAEQSGIPGLEILGGAWLVSAVTQSRLFFDYLAAWLAPATSAMSIDTRVDFMQLWSPLPITLAIAGFVAFGALGLGLLLRRGRLGLIGFGLLYFWIVFAVEFSAVRFQEPFALYRSYLWAPGLLIAVAAAMSVLPPRAAVLALLAVPFLYYQAHDRLQTFSGNLVLWEDAAAKLPAAPVPWGWRPLTNLAREQTHAGQIERAIATIDVCLSRYPNTARCHFARGAIHNYLGQHAQALQYLDRAIAINPESGVLHHQRGVALEGMGRLDEADAAYREADRRGYFSIRTKRR